MKELNKTRETKIEILIVERSPSMTLQKITVFLASSIDEFAKQRNELAAFIYQLNNTLIEQNRFIHLEICEESDTAIAKTRKQDEYNDFIKNCDLVIFLFHTKVGNYTLEEFEIAIESSKEKKAPKILSFFTKSETDTAATPETKNLLTRMSTENVHVLTYQELDEVKTVIENEVEQLFAPTKKLGGLFTRLGLIQRK